MRVVIFCNQVVFPMLQLILVLLFNNLSFKYLITDSTGGI